MKNIILILILAAFSFGATSDKLMADSSTSAYDFSTNSNNQYVIEVTGIADNYDKYRIREALCTLENVTMIIIEKGSSEGRNKVSFKSTSAKITQADVENCFQGDAKRFKLLEFAKK